MFWGFRADDPMSRFRSDTLAHVFITRYPYLNEYREKARMTPKAMWPIRGISHIRGITFYGSTNVKAVWDHAVE